MKIIKIIILTLICVAFNNLNAQEYIIQPKESSLKWTGKAALNSYNLTGAINIKNGNIVLDKNSIAKLQVAIDMESLNHENKDLKKHLRGKDFFEVTKYKEADFTLTESAEIKPEMKLLGQMKIKSISKFESFDVRVSQTDTKLNLIISIKIDRTAYGVDYNSPTVFESIKKNAIADEFELEGILVFKKV